MKRREFLVSTASATLLPGVLRARSSSWVDYNEGLVKRLLAEGETVFIDYYASWCSTCRAQTTVLDDLLGKNPAYERNMKFVIVDWDTYSRHPITTDHRIPRRSTLLVLRSDREIGRVVAQTSTSAIKELLDAGLAGA